MPSLARGAGADSGGRAGVSKGDAPLPAAPPPSVEVSSMPSSLALAGVPSASNLGAKAGTAGRGYERAESSSGSREGRALEAAAAAAAAALPLAGTAASRGGARPGSRAGAGAASLDFWSRTTAPQLLDASIRNPELKLQLLTRALEDSRAKLAHLQRDRAAVADALAALCAAAGAEDRAPPAPDGSDDAALPRRLDLLSTQLAALQEDLRARAAAVAEAEAAHERAALQVVQQQQHREGLERELEEARYTAQQHERAQHAMQVKLALLEEQLAATAESARRRMEEQLDTFRGDAATSKALRTKFAELEQQLAAAQRAQHAEADQALHLAAQVERLQGLLREASHKQAETSQQLWDKSSALNELTAQHRVLQADAQAMAAEGAQLRESLSASQQRAQRAEDLGLSLQAQCAALQEQEAALADEVEQLRSDLQQEREHKHRLQSALTEERLAGATQRSALQGRSDEVASLLLKLEEYSARIVKAEGALEGAAKQAAAAEAGRTAAEAAGRAARHENAALRDSLADLAASEARWKQQLAQAEERLGQADAALQAAQQQAAQQNEALGAAKERAQRMLGTLGEQSRQLEGMAALQLEAEGQKQQIADLKQELHAASARARAAQEAVDEVAAARAAAERELRKQQILVQRLQEQSAKQAAELRAAGKELAEARGRAESAEAEAAQQREAHLAATAAQEAAHQQRKSRNEQLEHDNRQQAIIIAELQAATTSANARLAATQQHNAALHRYAVAHGAAYGRLAAHTAGLHQQFARQLGGLRQLCRHLGLQLAAALAAADPLAGTAGACGTSAAGSDAAGAPSSASAPAADLPGSAASVAAAVLAIESLRTELQVAVQLLDMQAGGSEVQQLVSVPAGIAAALAADLGGLPAELLSSPRLEPSSPALGGRLPGGKAAHSTPVVASAAALAGPAASPRPAALPASPAPTSPAPQAAALSVASGAPPARSVLSAQVAQMEAHLQSLVSGSAEQAARAAAAQQLHEEERAARQRAQERVVELSSQLEAVQADLAATRGQRDAAEAQGRRLAQELWEANVGCACASCARSSGCGAVSEGCMGERGADAASVLCGSSSNASASSDGSEDGAAAGAAAAPAEQPCSPVRVLSLWALQQHIKEIYRAKALHDLAVARGQKPFLPLPDFVAQHLALQSGPEGRAVQQRARQLQASVEAHAGVYEVAMFGLSTGMLEEAAGALAPAATRGTAFAVSAAAPAGSLPASPANLLKPTTTAAAAVVPAVLYGDGGAAAALPAGGAVPALRRFCAADWHAACQVSAARRPLPQPFNPAASDQIHPMASEVHNLALGTPGVEQLMCWVLGGGVAASLPQLDLGLRLAENQLPQLYLLAVESCRLLGLPSTPQLYIKSSGEAAAYYLMLPGPTRLHGLNGSSASSAADPAQSSAVASPARSAAAAAGGAAPAASPAAADGLVLLQHSSASLLGASGSGSGLGAAAAAEGQGWQCALVLTSGLVDLLEPGELQAVMVGCLALHAALVSPAASGAGAPVGAEAAAQLAVLCRSMAALGTLGALAALCPDALAARLPHQMAPFLQSRILPLLRRSARYLSLYCDRVAAAAAGGWRPAAAAAVKQASGCALLRNELSLDAVLQQARELEGAAADLLPRAALREEGATLAAAGASWTLLRLRELLRWCGSTGVAAQPAS
ncbi:hypothetical protein ABPG75_004189 [Micractinium tetrahymenae]